MVVVGEPAADCVQSNNLPFNFELMGDYSEKKMHTVWFRKVHPAFKDLNWGGLIYALQCYRVAHFLYTTGLEGEPQCALAFFLQNLISWIRIKW